MNILFISLANISSLHDRGIYPDLLRELNRRGHHIYCISPVEGYLNKPTCLLRQHEATILQLRIGNIQKTKNKIEKGISTLIIGHQTVKAIKKYFSKIRFDLILYPTPPITFSGAVQYVKKRDGAKAYLLLKDIFPQNAVDLGMIKRGGLSHRFFLRKERELYRISDYIGCMSSANVIYLLQHNPYIASSKVEICPNSIEPSPPKITDKAAFKKEHKIPEAAVVFLYGGNLGKMQDIPFIIRCLERNINRPDRFFIICGDGTDFNLLKEFVEVRNPANILLWRTLPRKDFENIAACCDVGMIFLNHRCTIPNFPSRLLSYLDNALPVLVCTDQATDVGQISVDKDFGWRCESNDEESFTVLVDCIIVRKSELRGHGESGRKYLEENYTVSKSADTILMRITG